MLKAILTELHANDAFLTATLVATGHLDANASPERLEAVKAEMRAEIEAAGMPPERRVAPVAPVAPAAPSATVAAAPAAAPVSDPVADPVVAKADPAAAAAAAQVAAAQAAAATAAAAKA